jgi:hypothetical protein
MVGTNTGKLKLYWNIVKINCFIIELPIKVFNIGEEFSIT